MRLQEPIALVQGIMAVIDAYDVACIHLMLAFASVIDQTRKQVMKIKQRACIDLVGLVRQCA